MILNTYINLGDHLLMCDGIVSENGEIVNVTSSDKLILAFLHHRWKYFKNNKAECYDSMEFIALRTGNSVKTVERCISKFTKADIVVAEKRFNKDKKHYKWFWLGFKAHKYVRMEGDTVKEFISDDMSEYIPKPYYNVDKHKSGVVGEVPDYVNQVPWELDNFVPEFNSFDYEFEQQVGLL